MCFDIILSRAVAKYLYDRFIGLKEQKREENLNLSRILEGQTRSKSARFFYETLVGFRLLVFMILFLMVPNSILQVSIL